MNLLYLRCTVLSVVSLFGIAMNRLRRIFDPGFLVVLLICVLAVWPLVSRASLPEGTDAELHIFRLHELSYLIRGGEFYPRWAPDFYHGFGYPIFNYYAPLTYYLALPLELLPRVDAVLASKAILVVGMLLAGIGIYGFVRDNWGRRAGYAAAALYVYSPYLQYIDPHIRGALPEAFSFAAFPLALWALDRLRRRPSPGSWIAATLMIAAVILSHNLMGLFFYGLLSAWVLWQGGLVWRLNRQRGVAAWSGKVSYLAAAMLLGLGLAAFFWLPVILERNAVNLHTLIGANDNYDFRTHFKGLGELMAFSRQPDWGATQSPFRFNLGVAQWVGGLLGLVMLLLDRTRERAHLIFFALASGVVIFLMMPVSEPFWELIPFLPYFQFPWRLLGAAAAILAILGAAGVEAVARGGRLESSEQTKDHATAGERSSPRIELWGYALAVVVPMVLALPLSQPATWAPFGEVNTLRMSLIENSGRWLGTTSTADYVPATVIMLPQRRSSVVDPIAVGLPPDRLNREAMPEGATVTTETISPLLTRYHVTAPKQFRLRLYQFDFPGWRVRVDGAPAVTELAEPEGFIVVVVPQGEHVVEVEFGSTVPRMAAWVVTIISIVLIGLGAWKINKMRHAALRHAERPLPDTLAEGFRADRPIVITVALLTLLAIVSEPLGLFHDQSEGGTLDIPATEHYVNFGDQVALLGYSLPGYTAQPGETLDLTLYWQAQRALEIDYQVFVHLLDSDGNLVAQSDKLNPGDFPTRRWPLDKYVPDEHRLILPDNLPPGDYTLFTGLWVQSEGWRLPVFDSAGRPVGDRAELINIQVR